MRLKLLSVGLGSAAALLSPFVSAPALAGDATVIDLSYDSIMDMVRPEVHSGITLHRNFHVTLSERNKVSESRDREVRNASDSNSMRQVLGGGDSGSFAVWRVVNKDTLERIEHDPQSTKTMIVTLTSPTTCRLDIHDELKPGFNEYAFLRVTTHTIGYFSTYRITGTSCSIR